jgi:hypothetical protein
MSNDDPAYEALLKEQFALPHGDDGFCDRVMQQLPQRRRRLNWPLLTGFGMGVVSCGLAVYATQVSYGGSIAPADTGVSISWVVQLLVVALISAMSLVWIFIEELEGPKQKPNRATQRSGGAVTARSGGDVGG